MNARTLTTIEYIVAEPELHVPQENEADRVEEDGVDWSDWWADYASTSME